MEIYKEILLKARQEGKIKSELFPWETEDSENKNNVSQNHFESQVVQSLPDMPEKLSQDLKKMSKSFFLKAQENNLRVIGITNLLSNHETTFLAANVPFQFSRELRKNNLEFSTILIDTELKKSSIHELFNVGKSPGFSDIIASPNLLSDSVIKIPDQNLDIIPSGEDMDSSILFSDFNKIKNLFSLLKDEYRFIFLNIPYLFESSFSEKLCQFCDGIVLILPKNEVDWELLTKSKSILGEANTKVFGIMADL